MLDWTGQNWTKDKLDEVVKSPTAIRDQLNSEHKLGTIQNNLAQLTITAFSAT